MPLVVTPRTASYEMKRTHSYRVHFPFDMDRAVLALVDVHRLFHFGVINRQVPIIFLMLLCGKNKEISDSARKTPAYGLTFRCL